MVKNKSGGRNNRKMASKNAVAGARSTIRLQNDEDEIYAKATAMLGNGMATVICSDKKTRLLHIRKKFSGRNKRDNTISIGSILLVGLRSWEARTDSKKEKVDLLYVYNESQYETLKQIPDIYQLFHNSGTSNHENTDGFTFGEVETWQKQENVEKLSETKAEENVIIKPKSGRVNTPLKEMDNVPDKTKDNDWEDEDDEGWFEFI
tara:strand:- start:20699 stop:21316 length:618 start_codon:yes stop_codon:yes gene_type:complete